VSVLAREVRAQVRFVVVVVVVAAAVLAVPSGAADPGAITTVAGSVLRGFAGDGGPATAARLALPEGLAADSRGNLYVFDCDNARVRVIRPDGTIATIAGTGQFGFSGDGGPATSAQLRPQCGANDPAGLAVDVAGDVYIADTGNNRVRMVTPAGVITTVAGTGIQGFEGDGGPATAARLYYPTGLAVDRQGDLYIADAGNQRVRMVSPAGVIATVAGNGSNGCNLCTQGEGGPATSFALTDPVGLAVDGRGNVLIADWINDRVYAVTPGGIISVLAGGPHPPNVAGGFSGDGGPATAAELDGPAALAVDSDGTVYIADSINDRVRAVAPNGTMSTYAGDGSRSFHEGAPATGGSVGSAEGLALIGHGRLYIAATASSRVVTLSGPPAAAPPTVAASQVLPLPSNHTCTSRRAFPIRVRQIAGVTYSSATVTVNGRRVPVYVYTARRTKVATIGPAALNRNRFRAFVDLRGLVRGRYAVRVTVTTTTGRRLVATRHYRTCGRRKLAGSIPRL
jgi:sugar lactone lactonase YvrE